MRRIFSVLVVLRAGAFPLCAQSKHSSGSRFPSYQCLPSDYYFWLTGEAGKMLRGEIPFTRTIPARILTQH